LWTHSSINDVMGLLGDKKSDDVRPFWDRPDDGCGRQTALL